MRVRVDLVHWAPDPAKEGARLADSAARNELKRRPVKLFQHFRCTVARFGTGTISALAYVYETCNFRVEHPVATTCPCS